jgi:hypothetical protein
MVNSTERMINVSKRDVLKKIGAASIFVAANATIIEETSATSDFLEGITRESNFGVFNNSGETRKLTIRVRKKNRELFLKSIQLPGLNAPNINEPEKAYFKGKIDIQTAQVGYFPVEVIAENGDRTGTEVLVEQGGISDYAEVSVYVRPDGSLAAKHSLGDVPCLH